MGGQSPTSDGIHLTNDRGQGFYKILYLKRRRSRNKFCALKEDGDSMTERTKVRLEPTYLSKKLECRDGSSPDRMMNGSA